MTAKNGCIRDFLEIIYFIILSIVYTFHWNKATLVLFRCKPRNGKDGVFSMLRENLRTTFENLSNVGK